MDSESDRRRLSAAKEALQRELSKAQLEVRVPESSLLIGRYTAYCSHVWSNMPYIYP